MTRDEIMAMEAGPEMDAAVARALGWTDCHTLGGVACGIPPGAVGHGPCCAYSTDIAAAWGLVEEMRAAVSPDATVEMIACIGSDYVVRHQPLAWDDQGYLVKTTLSARGATAPLAICRAYLIAKAEG